MTRDSLLSESLLLDSLMDEAKVCLFKLKRDAKEAQTRIYILVAWKEVNANKFVVAECLPPGIYHSLSL